MGVNVCVPKDEKDSKGTEFGIIYLTTNMKNSLITDQEYLFCLVKGKVEFCWDDSSCIAERDDCFVSDPFVLDVPKGTKVSIKCLSDEAELNYACTENPVSFEPLFIKPGELLFSDVVDREPYDGKTMRVKRVFYDWNSHPESCLFCGEIINFPGSWACFPPHLHDEPEIYHYRFSSAKGYGFSEYGDDACRVSHLDTMCIPGGLLHSQVTSPGSKGYIMWTQRLKSNGNGIIYKSAETDSE